MGPGADREPAGDSEAARRAAEAGQWAVVEALARELEARRRARTGVLVVPFRDTPITPRYHRTVSTLSDPSASVNALGPNPKDVAELRAAAEEAERGDVLDAETSAAYLRWLETGVGPCPWPTDS